MKKIFLLTCITVIIFSACKKKDYEAAPNGNSLVMAYPATKFFNLASSGLNYFDAALLNLDLSKTTDTISVSANIGNPSGSDMSVTIGLDQNAFNTYLANKNNKQYALMPSAYYKIPATNATIKAGQTTVLFKIAVYPSLFDISQTGYLLPVSIMGNTGYEVNNNMKTAYFHVEKDPTPPFSRAGWTITDFDSQESSGEGPNNGRAVFVLDNNNATFWHSQWQNAQPVLPHSVTIDMSATQVMHGVWFIPRSGAKIGRAHV